METFLTTDNLNLRSTPGGAVNFDIFLKNGEAWEAVNEQIVGGRETLKQDPFPAIKELGAKHLEKVD